MNDPAPVSPADCHFRVASAADAPAVNQLFAEYLGSLGLTPDAELDADLVDFPAAYTAPGDTFLVATGPDGQLRGMGGIRRGELRRVFVRAAQRGRGLARALVLRLLQAAIATGQTQFHGVIARSNAAIREVDLACGLLPTGRAPAHPKQRDCEILAVTRPPDLSRPVMVLIGGTPENWRALLSQFAPQFIPNSEVGVGRSPTPWGAHPPSGAVFRALAENRRRTQARGDSTTSVRAPELDARAHPATPEGGCAPPTSAFGFNVLFAWHESEAATADLVREQAAAGRWVGAIRFNLARPERLPFFAEVAQTLAGPCRALLVLPGAETLLPALRLAFAPQLAAHPAARILRVTDPIRPAELTALLSAAAAR